jgi:hypothetical protein
MKDYVDALEDHKKKFKGGKTVEAYEKMFRTQENVKDIPKDEDIKKNFFIMKFPNLKEKTESLIVQYKLKIVKKEFEFRSK